ncbi:hypothetical protein CM19_06405 [Candidatus Acidianus copahuensis]|uniref:Uncharacterized protein n=1 Tax=Candidatus Acidianus copahuensis TaxID=1160895 RepID=A0A031LPH8_9CREN|nr:hypothetical protein [Candidatus Acidianus copahuensis]EZQ06987.1 hypothetical protein CM19_06405 [Candidatus Acidianus copahuensis]
MADTKIIGFAIIIIVLLVAAAIGFYEYASVSSKYTGLESSYSSLSSSYSSLNSSYSSLSADLKQAQSNASLYMKLAESNYSEYQSLLTKYMTLESMYKELEQNYSQLLSQKVPEQYKEGSSLDTAYLVWDGIAIESPNDVTPYLAPNFTAEIKGVPFPGSYNYQTFNSTWLSNFFSEYETVYFYTTALPTVTSLGGNTYMISAVLQYFVAPTDDPIYLQVFNSSVQITVQIINGKPLITSMIWNGNEVPPSAVISGYPSQHSLQANQVSSEILSEINGLGAEFPNSTIAQYFSPNAQLSISGPLPGILKNGTYSGISNIEHFFSNWDTYFIFVAEYSQNLLPSGVAVPPSISVTLTPNMTSAMVVANVTPFIGFVNQGEPGFPAIYDIHVNMVAYLQYNATVSSWQITKETWNVSTIPIMQDTMFYNLNQPIFKVINETTVTVNASQGAVLQAGNIVSIIQPGTYAELPNGSLESIYNFSLVVFSVQAVFPPAEDFYNLTPSYAFAFAINGHISPLYSMVTASKLASPAITIVYGSDTWTSWTWFGGTFNGTAYIGGSYKFADNWIYGNNVLVNYQFFKPVLWIFENSQSPIKAPPSPVNVSVSQAYGLTPVNAYSYEINGKNGGVIVAGNIITVIKPGTFIMTGAQNLTMYNFSVVYYATSNLPSPTTGQEPFLAFAYAINGNVTFSYTASQPFITIITTPDHGAQMWTWGAKGYIFKDPIVLGNGIVINLTFIKPVPWILTLPEITSTTTSTTTSSTSTTSSSYWGA